MSLASRYKITLYAQMNLQRPSFKPAPSTGGEVCGFGNFGDPERLLIERPGLVLAPNRHCKLDMIQEENLHACSHVSSRWRGAAAADDPAQPACSRQSRVPHPA